MATQGGAARNVEAPKPAPSAGRGGALAALSPAARMLVVNQFFISLGFSMVVPFLAIYLAKDLRMAPAIVGLIIGLRTLSSQGMLLVGGSLGDRLGPRPMIMVGCSVRVVAFGLFAVSSELWAIVLATILAGLGMSFFNPAVRTYLSAEAVGRRAEAFGIFNIAGNTGALLGPVIGGLLLTYDFRYVAGAGAAVFAFLTVAQIFLLPPRVMEKPTGSIWANWWEVARNGRFAVFTLGGAAFALMNTQISFAMVMEAARVTGRNESATVVYLVSALFATAAQVKVTRWARLRWESGQAMAVGVGVTALGWAPMIFSAPLTATVDHPTGVAAGLLAMTPVLLGAVIVTLGSALANPFMMELIPVVGSERMMGTYYGYYSLIGGLVAAGGSGLIGAAMSSDQPALRWAPFAILLAVGLAGAALLMAMQRRRALDPR